MFVRCLAVVPELAGSPLGDCFSAFAVGCPVCNKLVMAALGASGALFIWAPLQPVVAVAALALLGYTFLRRVRGELVCGTTLRALDASDS